MARQPKATSYHILGIYSGSHGNKIDEEIIEDVVDINIFGPDSAPVTVITGPRGKVIRAIPAHKFAFIKAIDEKEHIKWKRKQKHVVERKKVKGPEEKNKLVRVK